MVKNNWSYIVGGNDAELIVANDRDYHFYQKKKKSGGLISSKKMKRDEVTDTRAVGTAVESGGDLIIASGNDQVYQKARLDAGEDMTLTSGGDITFAAAMDARSESHEKSRSNWAWQSAKGKGSTDETLRQSELIAQGQLAINAANRVNIDVRDIDQQSVSQTIEAMAAAEPELAWLKQAEAQGDIDWRQVKEIHDSWDYSQSGVSPAVGMAVAIVAAAATSGAASSAIGTLSGTTSAATATTAASVWAAGTTTAASGWANAALSGAIAGAVGGVAGAASQGQDWQTPALHGAIMGGLANYLAAGTYYGNPLSKATDLGQQISQGALLDAGKVVGGVVMQKTWSRIAEKLAKGVGLNAEELNWLLMAGSVAGDQLPGIGNRYKADDQKFNLTNYVGERGVMDRDLPGLPFDAVDIALGYQGLPDASVRAYLVDQGFGGALTGHSLGTLTSNYLAGNGLVEHAELFSLPFGNIAAPGAHLTIGSGDLVNGGYLGKIFNPDAIVAPLTPSQHPFNNYKAFIDANRELYPTDH
ncbi:hypothetical protein GCM10010082_27910 [Kushneria pakistanensis]|uniref:DUF637 domain-containing protein n=1 Tax=Kushneria pakistanensis TaxID=1508770 RepID=A0ABQ3FNY1_9GAMM|nr:hemagglutinin repeat-containing protein [Kushneria pakistanensis]GHC32008.1 hypothetical protein GCM10010082_27910 [Kushneria pakistanensis]